MTVDCAADALWQSVVVESTSLSSPRRCCTNDDFRARARDPPLIADPPLPRTTTASSGQRYHTRSSTKTGGPLRVDLWRETTCKRASERASKRVSKFSVHSMFDVRSIDAAAQLLQSCWGTAVVCWWGEKRGDRAVVCSAPVLAYGCTLSARYCTCSRRRWTWRRCLLTRSDQVTRHAFVDFVVDVLGLEGPSLSHNEQMDGHRSLPAIDASATGEDSVDRCCRWLTEIIFSRTNAVAAGPRDTYIVIWWYGSMQQKHCVQWMLTVWNASSCSCHMFVCHIPRA